MLSFEFLLLVIFYFLKPGYLARLHTKAECQHTDTHLRNFKRQAIWLSGKESAYNTGDLGSIPGSGRSPGEGNGNLLQYSCLGNPMDREAWWATVHGVAKESDIT